MKICKKIIIIFCLIVLPVKLLQAQSQDKVYSVFVLNFAKYVQWPETKDGEYFVVGLFGSTTIGDYLKTVANLKTVGSQKISLKYCRSITETIGCHVLFIAEDKTSQVPDVILRLANEPTLLVTEKSGLARNGGGISFVQSDGKIKFEINKTAIEKKGMKISSTLSSLGIVVED